ncbi:MAG: GNAT family N-acetyltransferase [Oscillospiraceae bacterium]|nr:GNAT family N-acetyltransferase [Oscillospiraceae bacterium]
MISLRKILNDDMLDECLTLQVKEEQRKHCANNMRSLAEAWLHDSIFRPFCIYKDEVMVGFVMLEYDEAEKECGIWRIMIDEKYQGMGYGKGAMNIVLEYIRSNPIFEIIYLHVKPDNGIAIKLYEELGFFIAGETDENGELPMVLKRTV